MRLCFFCLGTVVVFFSATILPVGLYAFPCDAFSPLMRGVALPTLADNFTPALPQVPTANPSNQALVFSSYSLAIPNTAQPDANNRTLTAGGNITQALMEEAYNLNAFSAITKNGSKNEAYDNVLDFNAARSFNQSAERQSSWGWGLGGEYCQANLNLNRANYTLGQRPLHLDLGFGEKWSSLFWGIGTSFITADPKLAGPSNTATYHQRALLSRMGLGWRGTPTAAEFWQVEYSLHYLNQALFPAAGALNYQLRQDVNFEYQGSSLFGLYVSNYTYPHTGSVANGGSVYSLHRTYIGLVGGLTYMEYVFSLKLDQDRFTYEVLNQPNSRFDMSTETVSLSIDYKY